MPRRIIMSQTRQVLDTVAVSIRPQVSSESMAAAIDAMLECEEAITVCAAGMVTEDDVRDMQDAIICDMNCADVVAATRRVLTRGVDSALVSAHLEACVIACEHSAEQCAKHAGHHEHCRMCSEATGKCAEACRQVLRGLHG
jgi:hypothetical protein